MDLTLSDYGLNTPTTLFEAMDVIISLLDRCNQLNQVIKELEDESWSITS